MGNLSNTRRGVEVVSLVREGTLGVLAGCVIEELRLLRPSAVHRVVRY